MENERFDRATRLILEALQADARQSTQQLADKVGLSATPVWRRVKELEERGVIRRHVALVDREQLGLSICVLANVSLVRHTEGAVEAFEAMVAGSPEIVECQAITGEADDRSAAGAASSRESFGVWAFIGANASLRRGAHKPSEPALPTGAWLISRPHPTEFPYEP